MSEYSKKFPLYIVSQDYLPPLLKEIPDPPDKLFVKGKIPSDDNIKFLCVVGSRAYTSYGEEVCRKLISGLRGYNICIVSGLALGIDSIAHRAALDAGLITIAVPGSGLDPSVLYPRANVRLAEKILEAGGAIISEEEPIYRATPYSFPKRNRIMAGMSHAVLVIEAELKSGTLITSKYATDYNRDVFTVPGSIFSRKSDGPNMLIRLGATPVCTSEDILEALGFDISKKEKAEQKNLSLYTSDEKEVIENLSAPMSRDALIRILVEKMGRPISEINSLLVMMEIRELIVEKMGEIYIV